MKRHNLNKYYFNKKQLNDNCFIIEYLNEVFPINSKNKFQLPRYTIIVFLTKIN